MLEASSRAWFGVARAHPRRLIEGPAQIIEGPERSHRPNVPMGRMCTPSFRRYAANVRQYVRHQLPLVNEERCGLIQEQVGRYLGGCSHRGIDIQAGLRHRPMPGGLGFAARLRSSIETAPADSTLTVSSASATRGPQLMRPTVRVGPNVVPQVVLHFIRSLYLR